MKSQSCCADFHAVPFPNPFPTRQTQQLMFALNSGQISLIEAATFDDDPSAVARARPGKGVDGQARRDPPPQGNRRRGLAALGPAASPGPKRALRPSQPAPRTQAWRSVRPNAGVERFRLCDEDAAFHRLDAQLIPESMRL